MKLFYCHFGWSDDFTAETESFLQNFCYDMGLFFDFLFF